MAEASIDDEHLRSCVRCASLYVTFRSLATIERLPDKSNVPVNLPPRLHISDTREFPLQVLGRVPLETMKFTCSSDPSDWHTHRCRCESTSLSTPRSTCLLSQSSMCRRNGLHLPDDTAGQYRLSAAEPEGTFEFFAPAQVCDHDHQPVPTTDYLLQCLTTGTFALVFSARARMKQNATLSTIDDTGELLSAVGAIERTTITSPTDLHTDTHVNSAKLCHSEASIRQVARPSTERSLRTSTSL